MMSAYDPLPGSSDDEDNSVASSMESPPFALAQDDLQEGEEVASGAPSTRNETIYTHATAESLESQEFSSAVSGIGRSLVESSNSAAQDHSHKEFDSQVVSSPPAKELRDEGVETLVFDGPDSLFGSSPPMLGQSSHLSDSSGLWTHDSATGIQILHATGTDSLGFSQLMRQADDRNQSTVTQSRMPTLQEDEEMVGLFHSTTSQASAPRTTTGSGWLHNLFYGSPSQQNVSAVPMVSLSPSYLDRRMGASEVGRNIQETRLGENTFEVSMKIDPPCTVQDVMDVVGNPDLLRLWCDPIRSLIITKSSEGAQSAINRRPNLGNSREYEGEWIEGTTSNLVSPSKHSSCLYGLSRMLWTALGFPSYGKITMLVERRRGQVGLTIGPFTGDVTASHTINVEQDGDFISVVDKVRLSRDEEHCSFCCGMCEPCRMCFMPRMAGHMDQVLSSMLRLRVLVEHGETASYATSRPNPSIDDDDEGVSSTPLLLS